MERERSIPVQAVVCKIIQCAPLRYSAQQRISSFWKVDLTASHYTRAHSGGQVFSQPETGGIHTESTALRHGNEIPVPSTTFPSLKSFQEAGINKAPRIPVSKVANLAP